MFRLPSFLSPVSSSISYVTERHNWVVSSTSASILALSRSPSPLSSIKPNFLLLGRLHPSSVWCAKAPCDIFSVISSASSSPSSWYTSMLWLPLVPTCEHFLQTAEVFSGYTSNAEPSAPRGHLLKLGPSWDSSCFYVSPAGSPGSLDQYTVCIFVSHIGSA